MIKEMIKKISSYLPLTIDSIEWKDPSLILTGNNWSFSTISSWRIIKSNKFFCGCYDNDADKKISILKNLQITKVDIQSNHLLIDPVFEFANGCKLELFSTTFLEPWIFDFSGDIVYVSSP